MSLITNQSQVSAGKTEVQLRVVNGKENKVIFQALAKALKNNPQRTHLLNIAIYLNKELKVVLKYQLKAILS